MCFFAHLLGLDPTYLPFMKETQGFVPSFRGGESFSRNSSLNVRSQNPYF